MLDYSVLSSTVANPTFFSVFYAFLLSFILGSAIAILYIKTFNGLSYSRNFLQCLVLCPILTAIAMQAIGDNIARGIGMIGTISLLRFRTNIKDPRDMFFIFASLAIGLASGVHAYSTAALGTVCFGIAVVVLAKTPFAYGPQFDGLLRLNLRTNDQQQGILEKVLSTYCKEFSLISLREMGQGDVLDYAYHLKFRKDAEKEKLISEIKQIPNAKSVNLMMQESIVEI
ncbi:MAG: DUF4956 domain-containing protein [Oligoflexia bacterium]|nr:DUF4956 domain-containing protein [Oligoflexia bacterium]